MKRIRIQLVCTGLILIIVWGVNVTDTSARYQAFSCAGVTQIPQSECQALVTLYNSTNGSGWYSRTNWLENAVPSSWYGVTVMNGHVTQLALGVNNIVGTIPEELGDLTNLEYLYLAVNQLSGGIPVELGNLSSLWCLDLTSNQLSGEIPAELGGLTNLQWLNLPDNQLSGSIPAELGNLSSLQALSLAANQLSGPIPAEFGNLTNLEYLYLYGNQLSGNIPLELGGLTQLQILNLTTNQLSGNVPAELGGLSSLSYLDLSFNPLSGYLPLSLSHLTNLNYFDFSYTHLCEPVDAAFLAWKATVTTWSGLAQCIPGYSISGRIRDTQGASLSGVTVSAGQSLSAVTNAQGVYFIPGITPGSLPLTLTVTPSLVGYSFAPESRSVTVGTSDLTGVDFTGTLNTYSISGTVNNFGGGWLEGVTVSAGAGLNAVTNSQGQYVISGITPGSLPLTLTVTPSLAGYTFDPASRQVTVTHMDVGEVDFIAVPVPPTFSISGRVTNARGQGLGGALVSGVRVGPQGMALAFTAVTDAAGYYSLAGLEAGTYRLTFTQEGYTFPTRTVTLTDHSLLNENNAAFPDQKTAFLPMLLGAMR